MWGRFSSGCLFVLAGGLTLSSVSDSVPSVAFGLSFSCPVSVLLCPKLSVILCIRVCYVCPASCAHMKVLGWKCRCVCYLYVCVCIEDNRKMLFYKRRVMTCGCSVSVQDVSFPLCVHAAWYWLRALSECCSTVCAKVRLFLYQLLVLHFYFSVHIFLSLSLCETPWCCISPKPRLTHTCYTLHAAANVRDATFSRAQNDTMFGMTSRLVAWLSDWQVA